MLNITDRLVPNPTYNWQNVFNINHSDLMFYDNDLKLIAEPGEFDVMIGGNPRDVKSATFIPK